MINFNIGSLALITNGIVRAGFILQTPIEGFESPDIRSTSYSNPGRNGGTMASQFYDPRVINLEGIVYADNPSDYESYRMLLAAAVSIKKDSNGYPIPIRISFTTLSGRAYFLDVYFDKPMFALEDPNSARFQLSAVATRPFIYGATQITSNNVGIPAGGGYIVPMNVPYTSAASTGGAVSLNNPGTVEALPIVTLYGPLTNPSVTNRTTGGTIRLNYFLAAGNTATIDMERQLITLNNSSSLLGNKSPESSWWNLPMGTNDISIATTNTADTGYALVGFYPAYVGV